MLVLHAGSPCWFFMVVLYGGSPWWFPMVILHGDSPWLFPVVVLQGGSPWWSLTSEPYWRYVVFFPCAFRKFLSILPTSFTDLHGMNRTQWLYYFPSWRTLRILPIFLITNIWNMVLCTQARGFLQDVKNLISWYGRHAHLQFASFNFWSTCVSLVHRWEGQHGSYRIEIWV